MITLWWCEVGPKGGEGGYQGGRRACLHCEGQLHVDICIDWVVLGLGQLQ